MKIVYYEYIEDFITYLFISSTPNKLEPCYDDDLVNFLESLELYESAEGMYEVDIDFDIKNFIKVAKAYNVELIESKLTN